MFTKKGSYSKQIGIYLKNGEEAKASELASEFLGRFPDDMMANLLFAETAFRKKRYPDAAEHGRKAFNRAKGNEDMLVSALLTSSSYYRMGEYKKGHDMLIELERRGMKNADLEEALFGFSLLLKDEDEAAEHMEKLVKISRVRAARLIMKALGI